MQRCAPAVLQHMQRRHRPTCAGVSGPVTTLGSSPRTSSYPSAGALDCWAAKRLVLALPTRCGAARSAAAPGAAKAALCAACVQTLTATRAVSPARRRDLDPRVITVRVICSYSLRLVTEVSPSVSGVPSDLEIHLQKKTPPTMRYLVSAARCGAHLRARVVNKNQTDRWQTDRQVDGAI